MVVKRCVLFAAALAVGFAGCQRGAPPQKLVILCGSSFAPPAQQLIDEFKAREHVEVEYSLAGSEDFLPQVKAAAIGDVLITHDPFLDYVRDAGRLQRAVQVGFVAPVLAVQKGNPKKLAGMGDLAKPGLRVALTDPKYSTCGEMVFALLEKKGIKDAVLANVGNRLTKGHTQLGNYLKTDAADAVLMWNGVAHTFRPQVETIHTPYEYDKEVRVHVIGLNYTHNPALLEKFLKFIEKRGPAAFAEHGYVK